MRSRLFSHKKNDNLTELVSKEQILDSINRASYKKGYHISELKYPSVASFFYETDGISFYGLAGYQPDYDVHADYGHQYPWDQYHILNDLIEKCFGKACEYTDLKELGTSWGDFHYLWKVNNVSIMNFIEGHPRDGYYETVLMMKEGDFVRINKRYKKS